MKRLMICSTLLAVVASVGVLAAENTGDSSVVRAAVRPAELEMCIKALDSREIEERFRAVQDLSGLALDGKYRGEALSLLEQARQDPEMKVALQAEMALASLTGGDRDAVRAKYGIVAPDRWELAAKALQADNPEERRRALVALGRWHGDSEIATLLAATRDPVPEVRLTAFEFLGEMTDDHGADPLLREAFGRAVQDPEPAIRELGE